MTNEQKIFLDLAVIKQKTYDEISKEMGLPRATFTQWWEELKDKREELSAIRQIWRRKCTKIDFWNFYEWHTTTERRCYYCGISEDEINKLINNNKIHTKRLSTRGRTLEIERREPNKPYDDIYNLVYCCYWCNNAKTDEFTEQEFKEIGNCISEIWKNRLNNL